MQATQMRRAGSSLGSSFSDRQYSVLMLGTSIATCLAAVSMLSIRLSYGSHGIVDDLPLAYFCGIGLTILLIIWGSKVSNRLTLYNLVLLIALLWLVPTVCRISTPDYHTYEDFGCVNSILESGKANAQEFGRLTWPGWALWGSSWMAVSGMESGDWVMRLTPFVMRMAGAVFLFVLLSADSGLPKRAIALAIVASLLMDWGIVDYFTPPGFSYVLLSLFVLFVGLRWVQDSPFRAADVIIIIILLAALAVSHLLTALAAVALIALLAVGSRRFVPVVLLGITLVLVWLITWGSSFTEGYLFANREYLLSFVSALRESVFGPATQSGVFSDIASRRLYYGVSFAAISSLGLAFWLVFGRRPRLGKYMLVNLIAFVLLIPLNIASANTYVMRLYAYSRGSMGYFAGNLGRFRWGMGIILLLLILAVPASLWVRAGFQRCERLPDSYLTGLTYFHDHTEEGTVAEINPRPDGDPFPYGAYRNRSLYTHITQMQGTVESMTSVLGNESLPRPLYVIPTTMADMIYEDQMLKPDNMPKARAWLDSSSMNVVYGSNGVMVYWQGES